jgi:hypothetical protein
MKLDDILFLINEFLASSGIAMRPSYILLALAAANLVRVSMLHFGEFLVNPSRMAK